jgi:hypothetical protein
VNRPLAISACVVVALAGCGRQTTSSNGATSPGVASGSSPSTRFHPVPYSVPCVVAGFAKVGVPLQNVMPGSGAKLGFVVLQPDFGNTQTFQVTVTASPRKAERMMDQTNAIAKLHLRQNRGFRRTHAGNLFISYRDRPHESQRLKRGLDQITSACG